MSPSAVAPVPENEGVALFESASGVVTDTTGFEGERELRVPHVAREVFLLDNRRVRSGGQFGFRRVLPGFTADPRVAGRGDSASRRAALGDPHERRADIAGF